MLLGSTKNLDIGQLEAASGFVGRRAIAEQLQKIVHKPHDMFGTGYVTSIDYEALQIPAIDVIDAQVLEKIAIVGAGPVVSDLDFLCLPHRTHLSRTGRNVSIIFGRHLIDTDEHVLTAYPQSDDWQLLASASKETVRDGGPSESFPGSLGVAQFRIQEQTLQMLYLQSSINLPLAIELGFLAEDFRRRYSSWATCLIEDIFSQAHSLEVATVCLSNNNCIINNIGLMQIDKLARKSGFSFMRRENSGIFFEINTLHHSSNSQ